MTKSDTIKNLAEALCKFQASMEAITKNATNPFFKSKYASLSAIIEDTRQPLAKVGLSYAQFPTVILSNKLGDVPHSGLATVLMHTSGEFIADEFPISPVDQKPQSLGSAITYARRYALCSILGLQVEDDDGNEASKPAINAPAKTVGWQNPVKVPKSASEVAAKASETAKKKIIQDLCDEVALAPLLKKEDYEKYILENTGLALAPQNYGEIIEKIKALQNEKV